jgi:hypothetical protein
MFLLCRLCLWLALLCPALGSAKDFIEAKAFWTDTTGAASFEQARAANYTDYSGVLSKGFGQQVQWVRLKVGGVLPGTTDTLVLRIRPVFLDTITLYDPLDLTSGKAPRSAGDSTAFQSTEFESLHHTFVIPAQPNPREVWLRLSTTSTQLIHVEAFAPRDMLREEHTHWLAYSALLAVLFSSLLWVFISWLQVLDAVNGLFVLRQSVLLVYTASYLGYHRLLLDNVLSANGQDLLYCWTALLSTGLSFVFEYLLLREYKIPSWGGRLLQACLEFCVFQFNQDLPCLNRLSLCHRYVFDCACELCPNVHAVCVFNVPTGDDRLHKISLLNPECIDLWPKTPTLNRHSKHCE